MTAEQFDVTYTAFCRRRPFRAFLIEFFSGDKVLIGHPEVVRSEAGLYVMRFPDRGHSVFPAESVSRFLDRPVVLAQ